MRWPVPLEIIFGRAPEMGGGHSVYKPTKEQLDTFCPAHKASVDSSTDMSTKKSISSSSSGFHLFEIHSETMGLGIGAIFSLVAIIIVVVLVYKYCKSRSRRLHEARAAAGSRYNSMPMQPMLPTPSMSAPISPTPLVLAAPSAPPAAKHEAFSRAIALLP